MYIEPHTKFKMSQGKDVALKLIIHLNNPTKRQFLTLCNLMFTCRTNLTDHAISINDVYSSTDFLQTIQATRILSEKNMSEDVLTLIKKPYPYKLE